MAIAVLYQFYGFSLLLQVYNRYNKKKTHRNKTMQKSPVEIHVNFGEKHKSKLNQMFQIALPQINKITQWDYIPVARHKLYLPVI